MRSHGGLSYRGSWLDWVSADAIGADEADRAKARIELLHARLGTICRQLAIPGDLDGILSVEDEEHWRILGAGSAGFVVYFAVEIILFGITNNG